MAFFRAYKKAQKSKVLAQAETMCISDDCPDHPDLLLLRDAAADERTAIAFYLEAARNSCLPGLFLDVAEDEMHHFVELTRQISRLDPVQARWFRDQGLNTLIMTRPESRPKLKPLSTIEPTVSLPDRKEMPTVNFLTRAINDELLAINKYQRYMQTAEDPEVKRLFCHLMNEEKEHVAQFTAALFEITDEPLPPEHD